ncbi:MAG: branched-chain amino acid ABC transporter permease [Beijerinckiaceae bacterium]|nr:branched-chain amino acid ABC transporter permease [Beijerinckiaceae bacterium]
MTLARTLLLTGTAGLGILCLVPLALFLALPENQALFWIGNILARALIYGIIALSLTFLATYGGFVSLAQMMVAGIAGYVLAMTVQGAVPVIIGGFGYPMAILMALLASVLAGLAVGAIAVRTNDIYLLMITLALAVGFYRFVESNIDLFNGYEGIRNVLGPDILGRRFRDPMVFYTIASGTALLLYLGVLFLVRTPFGLALQGIRDNPRRISALGYNVVLHRIVAFGIAGFIAGCGGVLATIYNIGISPGSIGLGATINLLIMSVVGGLGHPVGAFVGSLIFAIFDTFAASLYDRDRFNSLIGAVFLVIVLISPDGALGLSRRLGRLLRGKPKPGAPPA